MASSDGQKAAVGHAKKFIDDLLSDPLIVLEVSRAYVRDQIERGLLVEQATLMMPGGFQMVPTEALRRVRVEVDDFRELVGRHLAGEDQSEALRAMLDRPASYLLPVANGEPVQSSTSEIGPEPSPEEERMRARARRPERMPAAGSPCVECQTPVDDEQVAISWSKTREVLCKSDFKKRARR